MPNITFQGTTYECPADETILNSLEAQGVHLVSGCRGGSCQACLMKAVTGTPTAESQRGLKATAREQQHFLPCICKPTEDMEMAVVTDIASYQASIIQKDWLNANTLRLRLATPEGFTYYAGQFINITRDSDALLRSYSLASIPGDPYLELHIRRIPNGAMSSWLSDDVQEGDTLHISGALGDCFYLPVHQHQDLLLIGTGTGLAPLSGLARQAIESGHAGEIRLFNAAITSEGLYYQDELRTLTQQHDNFIATPCVLNGDVPEGGLQGAIDKVAIAALGGDCTAWRAYLCGDPDIVSILHRACFMAGISSPDIYADAFTFSS